MKRVYITERGGPFAERLALRFREAGYEVVSEPVPGVEYFIETSQVLPAGDDRAVGEGIDAEAAAEAFRETVCRPVERLEKVFSDMTGKKRICFPASAKASINQSGETRGYGRLMARAALYQILTVTKNTWLEKGYTFRLFDPLTGEVDPETAADAAFVYFTRDRYEDGPDNPTRNDEANLLARDARGREIPW